MAASFQCSGNRAPNGSDAHPGLRRFAGLAPTPGLAHAVPMLTPLPLPPGIRTRFLGNGRGLDMHLLEAGEAGQPLLLLLHGFPELAYSWRKVMLPLAAAGYHVVAPDQRGYGRTTGWSQGYDVDLHEFGPLNYVRDALGLVAALGVEHVACVIGHDFGSPVAGNCALARPDVFGAAVVMSAPFGGPPALPPGGAERPPGGLASPAMNAALAALPRPRKHYQWHYSTRGADAELMTHPAGLRAFFRAYYHHKSADWPANQPHPLAGWDADVIATMPTYYIMDAGQGMAETVAHEMPGFVAPWLTEAELGVYADEYARTGFQGGLQSYRCTTLGLTGAEMQLFAGRPITVPSMFIGGASDWGVHQKPGDFERMQSHGCADLRGCHLVPGAGHWVMQEQPVAVASLILNFLSETPEKFA